MKWKGKVVSNVITQLQKDSKWLNVIEKIIIDPSVGVHLAIFNEPFLSLILDGTKKVESRFSKNKIAPYNKINRNDIVVLKESGGMVRGLFIAGDITFFNHVNKNTLQDINNKFGKFICSDYDINFWRSREKSQYVTLIEVKKIKELIPFKIEKKDRTGWSILKLGIPNTISVFNNLLLNEKN